MVPGSIPGDRIFAETDVSVAGAERSMERAGRGECRPEKETQADAKNNELASTENVAAKGKAISAERFIYKTSSLYTVAPHDTPPTPVKCMRYAKRPAKMQQPNVYLEPKWLR